MTKWQNTDNAVRLSGVVALGPRGTGFIRIPALPLFYWVATLGKLFTLIASPVSQLQETGLQKGVFGLDQFIGLTDCTS